MYNQQEEFEYIAGKTCGRIEAAIAEHSRGKLNAKRLQRELELAAMQAILEALEAGENAFPYQVGQRQLIGREWTGLPRGKEPEVSVMLAGFKDREQAEAYLQVCENAQPQETYGLFIGGANADNYR